MLGNATIVSYQRASTELMENGCGRPYHFYKRVRAPCLPSAMDIILPCLVYKKTIGGGGTSVEYRQNVNTIALVGDGPTRIATQ